ncbi:NlpC/P60 family protein [Streptomyces sp. NPDC017095]|uniref:NlpC/P60 family protein n=1 Tax=Streptomyces sp. NPDC017095 TaxID=3364977 RepID=UPI00378F28D2
MAPDSRDEVRQRIDFLYDQAENDTGNFNATRAMAVRARSRGVPPARRPGRRPGPEPMSEPDEITRQWFDTARTALGPTVPAVLPAARLPDRAPAPARLPSIGEGAILPGAGPAAALEPGPSGPAPAALEDGTDGSPAVPAANALPTASAMTTPLPTGAVTALPARAVLTAAPEGGAPVTPPPAAPLDASPGRGVAAPAPDSAATVALTVGGVMPQPPVVRVAGEVPGAVSLQPQHQSFGMPPEPATPGDPLTHHATLSTPPMPLPTATATATITTPAPPPAPAPATPHPASLALAPTPTWASGSPLTDAPVPEPPGALRALRAAKAVAFARAQVGKPCVWGATGPDSYDCSSLTRAAWRAAGVTLPRAAYEQALAGAPVTVATMEPGDLVFFFDDERHVGLHVGGGMMVHAPGPGSSVREESIYGAGEAAIRRIIRPA